MVIMHPCHCAQPVKPHRAHNNADKWNKQLESRYKVLNIEITQILILHMMSDPLRNATNRSMNRSTTQFSTLKYCSTLYSKISVVLAKTLLTIIDSHNGQFILINNKNWKKSIKDRKQILY